MSTPMDPHLHNQLRQIWRLVGRQKIDESLAEFEFHDRIEAVKARSYAGEVKARRPYAGEDMVGDPGPWEALFDDVREDPHEEDPEFFGPTTSE